MEFIALLLEFGLALAFVLYVVLTETTDWIGRAEIIEKRWPGLWGVMNNRPMRLVLIVLSLVLLVHIEERLRAGSESPEVKFLPLKAPEVPKDRQESPTSLRRRTIRMANDLALFWSTHPMPPQPIQNPGTDEERKRNETFQNYWREVDARYASTYKERVVGIIREYKAKGVPAGYLEESAEHHSFGAAAFTTAGSPICFQDEVCQFRELAYHVDGQDQIIILDF